MTTYTPTPEAVEAAAKAIAENTDEPGWSAVVIARAALTAAGPIIAAEALREAASAAVAAAAEFRAALAGSGEQPGERDATPDEAHDIGYAKGHTDGYREALAEHPAPVVPDSTDVLREAEAALIRATKGDDPTAWAGTGWWHVHRLLAVVGQGVTAEQARAEAERRFQDRDAGAERSLHHWFIEGALWASAAVRPSGQEGS